MFRQKERPTAAPYVSTMRPLGIRALRVTRSFTCEGTFFREGQCVSPDSDLVQRIVAEHPSRYFEWAK